MVFICSGTSLSENCWVGKITSPLVISINNGLVIFPHAQRGNIAILHNPRRMLQQEQLVWRCQNIALLNADDKVGLRPFGFHPVLCRGITALHTAMRSLKSGYPLVKVTCGYITQLSPYDVQVIYYTRGVSWPS